MKGKYFVALLVSLVACGEVPTDDGGMDAGPSDTGPAEVQHDCEEWGTGSGIGDKLQNARFTNCYGEEVWLHDRCGEIKLKVFAISTVWCPACKSYLRGLTFDHTISGGDDADWDYLIAVAQDASHSPNVSLEECLDYASQLEADPAKMVLDPNFNITLGTELIDVCSNNGSISLPHMAILDGWDMTYEYSRVCEERYPNGNYTSWREAFISELND